MTEEKEMKMMVLWVNIVVGLGLLVVIVLGWAAYFGGRLSSDNFVKIAVVASGVVMALTYFRWLRVRAAATFVVTAAVLVFAVMWLKHPLPTSSEYQAVFLTNGQVYFGHLKDASSKNPVLENIYYLQSTPQNPQQPNAQQQTQLSLVKLGNELHGPQDKMVLKSDQILFWENMKNDSKIVQAISQNQNK